MERLDSPPFFLLAEKLRTKYWEQSSVRCVFPDAHAVEGTVDEKKGDQEKSRREDVGQCCAVLCRGQLHGELDGEQAEERRELDDWIECDGRGVLERIADGVANDSSVVERGALLFELDLNDLLGVVPGAAGVGHENGLIQAKNGDGEKVADKKEGLDESEGQRGKKYRDENVQHAFLRVLRANLDDFLAVCDAGGSGSFELDVGFDEFNSAVSARSYGLRGSAGEPVNHGATGDQAENERRVKERKIIDVLAQAFGERHDDRKDHRGCPDDRCADEHGFGSSLESVAGAIVAFEHFLGAPKIHVDVVILLELSFDARNLFNQGKLID